MAGVWGKGSGGGGLGSSGRVWRSGGGVRWSGDGVPGVRIRGQWVWGVLGCRIRTADPGAIGLLGTL